MQNYFSKKTKFVLISLPSEIGGIFLGLILSTYHWLFFFIMPILTTLLFYFIYQYMIKIEKSGSIDYWFYFKAIIIQIIIILSLFIIISSRPLHEWIHE